MPADAAAREAPVPDAGRPAARTPSPAAGVRDVAVVITCYNHGRFLSDAIDSALAQSVPVAELIVVDDGSTDDTAAVAARYPAVRYIHQPNAGLSAARNTGLRAAASPFILFLDADDLLRPDAVAAGMAVFARQPDCAFIFGGHLGVTQDRRPLWEVRPQTDQAAYRALLAANVIGMHAAVLYRRDLLLAAGGFDTALRACEDYDAYLRLARHHPIACHDGIVAEYRQHSTNMSRDPERMLTTALAVLSRQSDQVRDPAERAALASGLALYQRNYGAPMLLQGLRGAAGAAGRGMVLRALRLAPRAVPAVLAALGLAAGRRVERRLPSPLRRVLRAAAGRPSAPPVGQVHWGDLRRTTPIDPDFGFGRGLPVDRFYIEDFLARHAADIGGRVLEVGDNAYTLRFGGGRVVRSDVLHISDPQATFVGDLTSADHIPSDAFDCVVLTQTLHLVFDMPAALRTLHRILKPGGVLLLTVPGISQIDRGEWGDCWYWSLTPAAVRRLLAAGWGTPAVESHGNVLSATAFLQGLAAAELRPQELAAADSAYPVIVAARAVKAGGPA